MNIDQSLIFESFLKGIFDFDRRKFANPREMIGKLKSMNFRVTVWIHPFVSCHTWRFVQYWRRGLLIRVDLISSLMNLLLERSRYLQTIFDQILSNSAGQIVINLFKTIADRFFCTLPGISLWWNGLAGVLDFTNQATCEEYRSELKKFQQTYDVDSFKFDAGEVNWLPIAGRFANASCQSMITGPDHGMTTPALYPYLYANIADRLDSNLHMQEVRVGYRTQHLPVFVRIIDKDSNWTYNNGLKSLLPSVFNLSLLGYPFILPDMVSDERLN